MTKERLLWTLTGFIVALAVVSGCAQAAPTPEPTPGIQPSAEVALAFTGQVENELVLSMADLQGMEVVEKTIEHPKAGDQTYTGLLLSTLLERAQPSDDATLTFTASDAYAVDVPVSEAHACADCMVAFNGDTWRLVMPGFGSSFWVREVVSIEAK